MKLKLTLSILFLLLCLFLSFAGYAMTPEEVGKGEPIKMAPCNYKGKDAVCVMVALEGNLYGVVFDDNGVVEIVELPSTNTLWTRKASI